MRGRTLHPVAVAPRIASKSSSGLSVVSQVSARANAHSKAYFAGLGTQDDRFARSPGTSPATKTLPGSKPGLFSPAANFWPCGRLRPLEFKLFCARSSIGQSI